DELLAAPDVARRMVIARGVRDAEAARLDVGELRVEPRHGWQIAAFGRDEEVLDEAHPLCVRRVLRETIERERKRQIREVDPPIDAVRLEHLEHARAPDRWRIAQDVAARWRRVDIRATGHRVETIGPGVR